MASLYEDKELQGTEESAFKKAFKLFKGRHKDLDFSKIIDVRKSDLQSFDVDINYANCDSLDPELIKPLHLRNPKEWRICKFRNKPGLTLISDIFTKFGHYYWANECLSRYPAYPNVTNIDNQLRIRTDFDGYLLKYPDLSRKLRWITLGYHHNWDTKIYDESNKSNIPENLHKLSAFVAEHALRYDGYNAEAAIINFYHPNSTLAGHVDKSEFNMAPPLLSFSFGQSAIFLVGGATVNEEPLAIYLRSGDLVAMETDCRLSYHAVPRIVTDYRINTADKDLFDTCDSAANFDAKVVDYLNTNRINMNIRQVN